MAVGMLKIRIGIPLLFDPCNALGLSFSMAMHSTAKEFLMWKYSFLSVGVLFPFSPHTYVLLSWDPLWICTNINHVSFFPFFFFWLQF